MVRLWGESPVEAIEYDFRLFSKPSAGPGKSGVAESASSVAAKIRLQSPQIEDREPGFVVPRRPRSFYFAASAEGEERTRFVTASLTGEQVRQLSSRRFVSSSSETEITATDFDSRAWKSRGVV